MTSSPDRAPGLLATGAIMAATLALFFLPAVTGTDQFLARDAGILHHPTKAWVAERWASGELPAWNPYAGLGVPVLSGAIDAVLHPFNLLLVALPFEAGFKAWVLLSFLAAAAGAHALARALGCGWQASVATGLAFALSGHLVGSSDNLTYLTSLAFIPWVLSAGIAFEARPGPSQLAAVGLASAVCAAGGDPQAWAFALLAMGAVCLLVAPREGTSRRRLGRTAMALGAAVLAAAPLWMPVLAWLPHSSRAGAVDFAALSHWDLAPRRLLEVVIPNLLRAPPGTLVSPALQAFSGGGPAGMPWVASIYFGSAALLLAAAGAALTRSARRLLLLAGALTWMACGAHLGFAQLASRVPVLGSFRYWEKLFIWPTLFTLLAAGLGVDALARAGPRARARFALAAGGCAAATAAAWAAVARWPVTSLGFLAATPSGEVTQADAVELLQNALDGLLASSLALTLLALVAAATLAARLAHLAPWLLAAALVVDPFSANGHAYALSPPPEPPSQAPLAVALRREQGVPRTFTPFKSRFDRWPELGEAGSAYRWGARTLRASWNIAQRVGNLDPYAGMLPARLRRLRDQATAAALGPATGIWAVAAIPVPGSVELAATAGLAPPFEVLASDAELPCALVAVPHRPRAYLAEAVAAVTEGEAQAATLALPPASTRSVVEGPLPPGLTAPRGSVRFLQDRPERVVLEAVTDGAALLVLSDQEAPGWEARVDGQPVPIVRTNLLARGVWLGPGRHEVVFTYSTPGLVAGGLLALAFALGLLGWSRRRAQVRQVAALAGKP